MWYRARIALGTNKISGSGNGMKVATVSIRRSAFQIQHSIMTENTKGRTYRRSGKVSHRVGQRWWRRSQGPQNCVGGRPGGDTRSYKTCGGKHNYSVKNRWMQISMQKRGKSEWWLQENERFQDRWSHTPCQRLGLVARPPLEAASRYFVYSPPISVKWVTRSFDEIKVHTLIYVRECERKNYKTSLRGRENRSLDC